MRAIALALLLALAGCSTTVQVNSGSTSSGGLHVQGQIHSRSLVAVILAGLLIGAAYEDGREGRPFPSLSVFSDWLYPSPPPKLEPGRHISEQDCTRPVDLSKGNLRCK